MPTSSCGRRHLAPLSTKPKATVRSTSVKAQVSVWPSFQPKRQEAAQVVGQLLLQVHAEAVLDRAVGGGLRHVRDRPAKGPAPARNCPCRPGSSRPSSGPCPADCPACSGSPIRPPGRGPCRSCGSIIGAVGRRSARRICRSGGPNPSGSTRPPRRGVAANVGRIVPGPVVHQAPVLKLAARIVAVAVVVEPVGGRHLAVRHREPRNVLVSRPVGWGRTRPSPVRRRSRMSAACTAARRRASARPRRRA